MPENTEKIEYIEGNLSNELKYEFTIENNQITNIEITEPELLLVISLSKNEFEKLIKEYIINTRKKHILEIKISELVNIGALIDLKDKFCEKGSIPHENITKFITFIIDNCLDKSWKEINK